MLIRVVLSCFVAICLVSASEVAAEESLASWCGVDLGRGLAWGQSSLEAQESLRRVHRNVTCKPAKAAINHNPEIRKYTEAASRTIECSVPVRMERKYSVAKMGRRDVNHTFYLYFDAKDRLFGVENNWQNYQLARNRIIRELKSQYPQGHIFYAQYTTDYAGRKVKSYVPSFHASTPRAIVFTDASSTYRFAPRCLLEAKEEKKTAARKKAAVTEDFYGLGLPPL